MRAAVRPCSVSRRISLMGYPSPFCQGLFLRCSPPARRPLFLITIGCGAARRRLAECMPSVGAGGAVAELVGIEGGVVSGVINLESSGVEASDWRPRHDKH